MDIFKSHTHSRSLDSRTPLDENGGQTTFRLTSHSKVIRKGTVGDPLLGTIDNPVLAIFGLGRRAVQAGDVGAGKCFGDGERDEFLGLEDFGDDACLEFIRTKVDDGWETNDHASEETVTIASCTH